jgi:hypothetical protein
MGRGLCEVLTKKPKAFEEEFLHNPLLAEVTRAERAARGQQEQGAERRSPRLINQNVLRSEKRRKKNLDEAQKKFSRIY